jgi:hypothetical protein
METHLHWKDDTRMFEGNEENYQNRTSLEVETHLVCEISSAALYQSLSFNHLRAPDAADLHCTQSKPDMRIVSKSHNPLSARRDNDRKTISVAAYIVLQSGLYI